MAETVLLVEDDATLRHLADRLLTRLGYTVILALGAESAVAHCQDCKHGIDLLITDVNMPDVGGPELARRLLAIRPGLKVLYVSGSSQALDSGLLTPGAGFLQKPFTTEALSKKLRAILNG
jgi:two-component system cell cycle sensor histidine kinase/response regulator CckA